MPSLCQVYCTTDKELWSLSEYKLDYVAFFSSKASLCACDLKYLLLEVASHFSQAILTKYLPTSPSGVRNERCSFLCIIGKNMFVRMQLGKSSYT